MLNLNKESYDDNNEPILSIIYKMINDFPYLSAYLKNADFKRVTSMIDMIVLLNIFMIYVRCNVLKTIGFTPKIR